jgi:hypothetical protein
VFVAGRNHYGQLGLGDFKRRGDFREVPYYHCILKSSPGSVNNTWSQQVVGICTGIEHTVIMTSQAVMDPRPKMSQLFKNNSYYDLDVFLM